MQLIRRPKTIIPNIEDAAWLCSADSEHDEKKVKQILAAWAKAVETDEGRALVLKFGLHGVAHQAMREGSYRMAVARILPWLGIPDILTGSGIEFLRTIALITDPMLKESFVNLFVNYVEACCEEDEVQLDEGMTLTAVQKRRHQEEHFTRQVNSSLSTRKLALHSLSMRAIRFRRRSIERAEAAVTEMHTVTLHSEVASSKSAENAVSGEQEAFSWERSVEELEERKRRLKQCIDEAGVALDAAMHEQRQTMSEQDRLRQKLKSLKEYGQNEDLDNCKAAAHTYAEMIFVSRMITTCEEIPPLPECVPVLEDSTADAESARGEFQQAVEEHLVFCTRWYESARLEADTSNSRTEMLGTSKDVFVENQLREATEALRQARSVSQHYLIGASNDDNPDTSTASRTGVLNRNLSPLQIDGSTPCCMKLDDCTPIGYGARLLANPPQIGGLDDF